MASSYVSHFVGSAGDSILNKTPSFADAKKHFGKQNQVASHFDQVKMREQQNKEIDLGESETRNKETKNKEKHFCKKNV